MNKAIEEKVVWTPDPEITQAGDLMEDGRFDEAAATLGSYLITKPDSVEAWSLLRAVHWRGNKIHACREATVKLCGLHAQAREYEAAWKDYQEFLTLGGDMMPPAIWLDLCRLPEEQQDFETRCQRVREARRRLSFRTAVSCSRSFALLESASSN